MTVAVPNSAFALNDDAWANLLATYFPTGFPWLDQSLTPVGRSPIYTTLPVIAGSAATPQMTPTDSLYDLQWHFDYLGDIEKIWEEYSGAGVNVGIYDDGIEINHPDLQANYNPDLEVTVDGKVINPNDYIQYGAAHGTSVAGLIAAANNGTGVVGVAWGASLTGVNIFSGDADINNYYAGFLQAVSQSANFDVINHSWGKYPGFWQDGVSVAMDESLLTHWFHALETGRNGFGTIQVKAAGNQDQNANGDLSTTTRATIVVGAYDDDGDVSYYSSYGANLLVSAPSSGSNSFFGGQINRGLVTTDNSQWIQAGDGQLPLGYNGLPDDAYTNGFGGTSGATPIVTGVIALMLEANPDLGWRDVQNILAYSAMEVGSGVGGIRRADENNDWTYNGADNWNGGGLHYSEDYGYGGINAYNAVRMAEVWHLFGGPKASANESSFKQSTTSSVDLLDGKTTDIKFVFGGPDFLVDFVNVSINLSHTKLDDLEIYLISPDGTETTLIDFRFELQYNYTENVELTFGANSFRGENGAGEWTIRIVDRWLEDSGTLNSASVTLHGTDTAVNAGASINDVYHYTDEVLLAIAREGERFILTDTDGGTDWLDLSAMTGNLLLRMSQGWTSAVDGKSFLYMGNNTIENAVAGDGNDDITGTVLDNVLYGMRGNDRIFGGGGNDTISGGAGNDTLIGGTGNDNFLFDRALNAATNVDTITDFNSLPSEYGQDKIWLDVSIFTSLSALVGSSLVSTMFYVGTSAVDGDDYILYDLTTGRLFYDADGNGTASSAIHFATLTGTPTLSYSDFVIVDTTASLLVTGSGVDRVQADTETTSTSIDTENLFGTDAPINGTQYDDEIFGKNGNDIINGLGGNDILLGGGGNDIIDGGTGFDQIYGQDGDDILYGGGSPTNQGDYLFGGAGNDIIHGSDQTNGPRFTIFPSGDSIAGEEGDDILYGYAGDDAIDGGEGNDIIYGGDGNDMIWGGLGDDHIYGGLGTNDIWGGEQDHTGGFDTIHFDGNFDDYVIVGMQPLGGFAYNNIGFLVSRVNGLEAGQWEHTSFEATSIEALQFADRYIDLMETPILLEFLNEWGSREPLDITTHGFERAVIVENASSVTITDDGGATGVDALNFAQVRLVSGDVVINADSLGILSLEAFQSDFWSQQLNVPGFTGDVTVNAAAGDRELLIYVLGVRLDAGETVSDNTATSIVLNQMSSIDWLNGAEVNDYNLSFASAESIKFFQSSGLSIKWYIPNVTTIDLSPTVIDYPVAGNSGYMRIDTPLDDSVLATAGGLAEYRFIGGDENNFIQLGNRGSESGGYDLSNDGTVGAEAGTNAGMGLRGTITLAGGADEVRILGSGAFQGGTIDAGWRGDANQPTLPDWDTDVIRMTFKVGEAIGNISSHISGFEAVQFDVTSLGGTVSAANFDSLTSVIIGGTEGIGGTSTVHLMDGSSVEFRATNDATRFGTVNLAGSAAGINLAFTAPFQRVSASNTSMVEAETDPALEAATGTVRVVDATVVNITTNSRDDIVRIELPGDRYTYGAPPPVDSFQQVLVLDNATTVTVAGDTGWDFTVAGSDISKVTRIDASGVTATGALGAVKATAQNASGVHFTGGAGDDVFAGGAGNDTFEGGAGNDTYIIDAGSASDTFIEAANGGIDTAQSAVVDIDLNDYTNIENATLTGSANLNLTGNSGRNTLKGNAGNNLIDGGLGADTVVFSGNRAEYNVVHNADGSVTVTDLRSGSPDGVDTLVSVEYLQFADGRNSVNPAAPTDILLSNDTVSESNYDNLLVGTLSAVDDDGDTAAFELVDDSNGRFHIVNGNEVRTVYHTKLDYEQSDTYVIRIRVTDGDGETYEKDVTIHLTDLNPEYMVGRGDIDEDDVIWGGAHDDFLAGNGGNDTFRGNGGSDIIRGGPGEDTAEYSGNLSDYVITWQGTYSDAFTIHDKRSNADGTGFDGIDYVVFSIFKYGNGLIYSDTVEYLKFNDVTINTWDLIAPNDMALSQTSVGENAAAGTIVGSLTTSDLSSYYEETFTYALLDDAGGLFALDGDKIIVAGALDYETATSHTIKVRVTDGDGHTFDKTFAISVEDVEEEVENSAPTDIAPETASIAENSANGTVVAAFETEDPDSGDTFTYTLANNASGRFAISGNKLVVANGSKLDYEASASHQVVVRATDAGGLWVEKTITVAVTDVNEKASVTLANRLASIKETASTASRTKVADIVVTDDALGRNALSLVGRDRALFEIVGMALYLKAGAALDASKLASLEVAVAVDDAAIPGTPDATSATYKLAVADVAGLKMVHGTSASQTLTGSSGSDWFDGHGGDDTFKGGRGDDIYLVDSNGDTVVEGKNEGTDTVRASVTHTLAANVENLVLTGSSSIHGSGNGLDNVIIGNSGNNKIWGYDGNDLLRGGAGDDGIDGGAGNDRLYGEAGNDTLKGGSGNDHLDGGAGTDALWGGSGKDVFDFDFTSDSAVGSARDVIYDFERGKDRIDLANIDANTGRGGDQAFTWLGDKAFTGKAGELHFLDKGAEVIVQGDVNGDKIADFDILVKVGSLSHSDFVL